jgi:hypothetical protein
VGCLEASATTRKATAGLSRPAAARVSAVSAWAAAVEAPTEWFNDGHTRGDGESALRQRDRGYTDPVPWRLDPTTPSSNPMLLWRQRCSPGETRNGAAAGCGGVKGPCLVLVIE